MQSFVSLGFLVIFFFISIREIPLSQNFLDFLPPHVLPTSGFHSAPAENLQDGLTGNFLYQDKNEMKIAERRQEDSKWPHGRLHSY